MSTLNFQFGPRYSKAFAVKLSPITNTAKFSFAHLSITTLVLKAVGKNNVSVQKIRNFALLMNTYRPKNIVSGR